MGECMTFPDTFDEFLEQYQFRDSEEVYTNGAMLVPVFRVKQWVEHANCKTCKVPGHCDVDVGGMECMERRGDHDA